MTSALSSTVAALEREVSALPPEDLPAAVGELARLHGLALARIIAGSVAPRESEGDRDRSPAVTGEDRWIDAGEASRISGLSKRWFYEHHRTLPFARKISHKVLRFHEARLRRWLETRKGLTE